MKTWKKLLSLLMVFAMVFTLAACGKNNADTDKEKTPEELLCAEWVMEADLSDLINTMLTTLLKDFPESKTKLPFTISFTFDDKGEYIMKMDMKDADFDAYLDDLCGIMVDYMLELAKESNTSEADFRAEFEKQNGMTLEEYAASTMEQATSQTVKNFKQTNNGYYKLVGNTIYMDEDQEDLEDLTKSDESMTVTITEQTLKIIALGGEDAEEAAEMFEAMGLELPWELHKQ